MYDCYNDFFDYFLENTDAAVKKGSVMSLLPMRMMA